MDQGLPVNFENTASTWQNMPGFAAFYTGLQNQAAQDNIRMLQEAYAKDQAFKEKSRPIELNNLMSAGELQHAQAINQLAQGRNTNAEAGLREGVLPSAIEAGISKNKTAVVEDQGKVLKTQGEMFKELATRVSNPNIPNKQKVDEVMRNLKIDDPDGTIRQGLLQNIDKLPKILAAQAEYHFQNDPATKLQKQKDATDIKQSEIAAGASRYGADRSLEGVKYSADARVKSAEAKNSSMSFEVSFSKLKNAKDKIAALADRANEVEATNPELAASLRARANDPTLHAIAQQELAAGGAATVEQKPGQRPGLASKGSQVDIPAAGPQKAVPTAPAGRIIVYKNGKPWTVPANQADQAVSEGYSLK